MKLGMVGLGRMGGGMTARLLDRGHRVVAYDPDEEARSSAAASGADEATSLEELAAKLDPPRVAWAMVPAGEPTETTVRRLGELLEAGDVLVDGGNSHYRDSMRRARDLDARGIRFVDCGVSGGIWGLRDGYCLMAGGEPGAVALLEPAFRALAPEDGYAHVGPPGAGHFVKMVHNAIEYGMLAAYGEGFELLHASPFRIDLPTVAGIWRRGSVIRSWLLDLLHDALRKDPDLGRIRGYVEDSGEGRWTVETAVDEGVPVPITALALFQRFASRQDESFAAKVIAALRAEFGGHEVRGDDGP